MKRRILFLRIFETLFLVGVIFEFHFSNARLISNFEFMRNGIEFGYSSGGEIPVLSTTLFGYLLSIVGTTLQGRFAPPAIKRFSLLVSILGILTCVGELVRMILGYDPQVTASFPIVLVLLDWSLFWKIRDVELPSSIA